MFKGASSALRRSHKNRSPNDVYTLSLVAPKDRERIPLQESNSKTCYYILSEVLDEHCVELKFNVIMEAHRGTIVAKIHVLNGESNTMHIRLEKWKCSQHEVSSARSGTRFCCKRNVVLPSNSSGVPDTRHQRATNEWRFWNHLATLEDKTFPRCTPATVESDRGDTLALPLGLPPSPPSLELGREDPPMQHRGILTPVSLDKCHALIAEPLVSQTHIPKKWWTAFCITTLWHLWLASELARNAASWDKIVIPPRVTQSIIWQHLRIYVKAEWQSIALGR